MPGPSGGSVLPALAAGARAWSGSARSRSAPWPLLVVLAVVAGVAFAGSADRIAAGVSIQGVNVGGLTAAEAEAKLEALAVRYADEPVVFTAENEQFMVRPEALEVQANWAGAVEEALDRATARSRCGASRGSGFASAGPRSSRRRRPSRPRSRSVSSAWPPASTASRAKRRSSSRASSPRSCPASSAGSSTARPPPASSSRRSPASTGSRPPLPVAVDPPKVTADTLAPVARQLRAVLSAPVLLTHAGASFTVEPAEMVGLLQLPADGATRLRIKPDEAAGRFENLARGLARAPRNADFAVRANGRVRVVPSRPGRELNVAATSAGLLQAASRPENRTATVVVAKFEPRMTTAQAKALRIERQLASYATLYAGTSDRINNLQLAIEILDGARIAPGATWSFNEFVGPRTAERGFRSAPVIMDGKYEEGIGGGVSQVATTVFNAAWEAGIKIPERHAHALYISRYPDGRDATVNYPDVDLKLTNDTPRWIVLKASYDESGILVRFLGGGPERRVESVAGELKVTGRPKTSASPTRPSTRAIASSSSEGSRRGRSASSASSTRAARCSTARPGTRTTATRRGSSATGRSRAPSPLTPPEEKPKKEDPPTTTGPGDDAGSRLRRSPRRATAASASGAASPR